MSVLNIKLRFLPDAVGMVLVGNLEKGGAIANREAYENFMPSYAHLFPDGKIRRYDQVIGTKDDIEIVKVIEGGLMSQTKRKDPVARKKKQLGKQKELTAKEIHDAMLEASKAIDVLTQEKLSLRGANVAMYEMIEQLKKIIVAERAQVIYYTQRALDFMHRKDVSVVLTNFADLPEGEREMYVKRAIVEVGHESPIIPHEELKAAEEKANPKKKLEVVN